jgi:hypothetical protein
MSQDNININVTENIDEVNIVASEVVEVVDLNLYATTEDVTINVTEDIIQVNINKVTSSNVTKTSDLINDGADGNSTYVETEELGAVAFSNDYNDLDNLPTIPEEITKTSDLINDGEDGVNPFITLEDIPAPITIDAVPTDGSSNAVSSNGVFDALATKQNTIGFTPENVANKSVNLTSPDNTKYPTTQAVVDGLATKQNTLTNPVTGTGANGQVVFWNGTNSQTGDNGLFWDNTNKRLGVGTASPSTSLDVNGIIRTPQLSFGGFDLGKNLLLTYSSGPNFRIFTTAGQYALFGCGGLSVGLTSAAISPPTSGATIQGNVLIGTTTDAGFRLDVNGTTRLNGNTSIGGGTAGARLDVRAQGALSTDIAFRVRNSADTADLLSVLGNGNVGIGTTSPTGRLSVTDTVLSGSGSLAGSLLDLRQTWNTTGTPNLININVTNTASDPAARIINTFVNGINIFNVNRLGGAYFGSSLNVNGNYFGAGNIGTTFGNLTTSFGSFNNTTPNTITTGINRFFLAGGSFTPTSGTGVNNGYEFSTTINQTGGANGITRGLFINPTLTSAFDFRAIEISRGGAYINTTSVQASAILQADSTTKGFLPPRMTNAQRLAIASPAVGLMVYCTDMVEGLYVNKSTGWTFII